MLLVSMTVGTIVLMSLGNTPPGSGAFSLASYYQLGPLAEAMKSRSPQDVNRWEQIEIVYGQPHLLGLAHEATLNAHFLVCNHQDDERADGDVLSTERWQTQDSTRPQRNWGAPAKTIVIAMIKDNGHTATSSQMARVDRLVTALWQKFEIDPYSSIHWPQKKQ